MHNIQVYICIYELRQSIEITKFVTIFTRFAFVYFMFNLIIY